jgi:uncharacterized protein YdeI (YjbR/CyaY-like superfamily)
MTDKGRGRKDGSDMLVVRGRSEWRDWLNANHDREDGVWLLVAKKGSAGGISYEEAVEEALCFGWIDSTARAHDHGSFKQRFSPRRRGSAWSRSNRERVARLIERGQMTPAGTAKVEGAKRDGSWGRLEAVEGEAVPDDLAAALEASPAAMAAFYAYNGSRRKQLLWWLVSAKRAETRRKRVEEIVRTAEREARPKAPVPRAED